MNGVVSTGSNTSASWLTDRCEDPPKQGLRVARCLKFFSFVTGRGVLFPNCAKGVLLGVLIHLSVSGRSWNEHAPLGRHVELQVRTWPWPAHPLGYLWAEVCDSGRGSWYLFIETVITRLLPPWTRWLALSLCRENSQLGIRHKSNKDIQYKTLYWNAVLNKAFVRSILRQAKFNTTCSGWGFSM